MPLAWYVVMHALYALPVAVVQRGRQPAGSAGQVSVELAMEPQVLPVPPVSRGVVPVSRGVVPLSGTVAWINPPHAQGNRPQGVGIRLPENEVGKELKKKIEGILAPVIKSDRPTHTL